MNSLRLNRFEPTTQNAPAGTGAMLKLNQAAGLGLAK